jgi:hypothetical protein
LSKFVLTSFPAKTLTVYIWSFFWEKLKKYNTVYNTYYNTRTE